LSKLYRDTDEANLACRSRGFPYCARDSNATSTSSASSSSGKLAALCGDCDNAVTYDNIFECRRVDVTLTHYRDSGFLQVLDFARRVCRHDRRANGNAQDVVAVIVLWLAKAWACATGDSNAEIDSGCVFVDLRHDIHRVEISRLTGIADIHQLAAVGAQIWFRHLSTPCLIACEQVDEISA
jgi:hypothetical protein